MYLSFCLLNVSLICPRPKKTGVVPREEHENGKKQHLPFVDAGDDKSDVVVPKRSVYCLLFFLSILIESRSPTVLVPDSEEEDPNDSDQSVFTKANPSYFEE